MGLSVVQFTPVKSYTDTGWIPITVNSPVVAGTDGCNYRIMDGVCYVQMHVSYSGTWAAQFTITTLPVECRPSRIHWFAGLWYGASPFEFKVFPSGAIQNTQASPGSPGGFVIAANWPVG